MKNILVFLALMVFVGGSAFTQMSLAFDSTLLNPKFYSRVLAESDLAGAAETGAKKLIPQNKIAGDVVGLAANKIKPEIIRQTEAGLQSFLDFLQGTKERAEFDFDLSTLKSNKALHAEVADLVQKRSNLEGLPKSLTEPLAEKAINTLPAKLDLLSRSGISEKQLQEARAASMEFFGKYEGYKRNALIALAVGFIALVLLLRKVKNIVFWAALGLLLSSVFTFAPSLYFDTIAANWGGGAVEFLRESGIFKNLVVQLKSQYAWVPTIGAIAAAGLFLLWFVLRRSRRNPA